MGKTITFYAGSLPHFTNHLAPIYQALPDHLRGSFYAKGRALAEAQRLSIPNLVGGVPCRAELVCCASYEDYRAVRPSPVILVNHGVGQRYIGDESSADHPSYSGGRDRDRVALNICPSRRDAEVCRDGGSLAAAVGSPRLDKFHGRNWTRNDPPVVAFSFHADAHACAETRWAFPHYRSELIRFGHDQSNLPFKMLGHSHPRMWNYLSKFWKNLKVEMTPNFDDVLERADLYVCDNSSTLYEFAAVGKPVLVLNAPWYRRDVHHGLRFWDAIPGLQVNFSLDLFDRILFALQDPPSYQQMREEAVQVAYSGLCDGRATERAVNAIMEFLDG